MLLLSRSDKIAFDNSINNTKIEEVKCYYFQETIKLFLITVLITLKSNNLNVTTFKKR